jgi:predicted type IV restriction endonuclease
MTQKVREQFAEIVKRAFSRFISERINERLKAALGTEPPVPSPTPPEPAEKVETQPDPNGENRIVTTEEEREGYYIIKAILREKIDPSRIAHRDTVSYMGILLDDNNRKTICRLLFNNEKTKYIALFDKDRNKPERVEIVNLNDIYKHSARLIKTIESYDKA